MKNLDNPTFEEVDAHFKHADMSIFVQDKAAVAAVPNPAVILANAAAVPNPAVILAKACAAYKLIRPFLALVLNVPLFPSTWKTAIKGFMTLMNSICP